MRALHVELRASLESSLITAIGNLRSQGPAFISHLEASAAAHKGTVTAQVKMSRCFLHHTFRIWLRKSTEYQNICWIPECAWWMNHLTSTTSTPLECKNTPWMYLYLNVQSETRECFLLLVACTFPDRWHHAVNDPWGGVAVVFVCTAATGYCPPLCTTLWITWHSEKISLRECSHVQWCELQRIKAE